MCSAYINRLQYPHVRKVTELAALATIGAGICLYYGESNNKMTNLVVFLLLSYIFVYANSSCNIARSAARVNEGWENSYLVDLLSNAFLGAIVQALESYFMLYRYLALSNTSGWLPIVVQVYIWLLLVFSYLSLYTIVPLVFDLNSKEGVQGFFTCIYIYLAAQLLFNFCLGLLFYQHLRRVIAKGGTSLVDLKLRWVTTKLVIQCFIRWVFIYIYTCVESEAGEKRLMSSH